ncbi:Endoribonuclease Dcr-1 [Papilio xuthus]|uniref:Endoribonuclease Dcr-1 n=1 Tax=Papilio xuthus TaxID=66420 RepID=A0A0N1PGL0_PAPXU|nr:Endoribonuclease Dcr-1 [Papilio xuthus]
MGVRIEYKTAHEAEAVDVERVRRGAPPPHTCELDDAHDMRTHRDTLRNAQPPQMVSNLNLYRLGRGKRLGARMTASKFEPHDNWLPPCHRAPPTLHHKQAEGQEQSMGEGAVDNAGCFIPYNLITQHSIPGKDI